MTEFTQSAVSWGLHTAAAGVAVFGLGWAWVRRVADPARRQHLAGWVVRGGLLAAVLALLPAWLLLPAPEWDDRKPAVVADAKPEPPLEPVAEPRTAETREPQLDHSGEPEPVVIVVPPVVAGEFTAMFPEPEREREPIAYPAPALTRHEPEDRAAVLPPAPVRIPVAEPVPVPGPWPGVVRLVLVAYAVGVGFALVPLLLGILALSRLRRTGRPAPERVQAVFDTFTAGSQVRPRLLVGDRLGSPVCFGLFRPVVVLPRDLARTATDTELRWVFAHELDHLRRGDPWTGWWVGFARALYFAVPWFWRVRRELVLAQEYLADAAAAAAGGRVEDYAAFLVRLSGGPGGRRHPVGAAAVRAGKSDLFRRVTMLLTTKGEARQASRRWSTGVTACAIGAAVILSGVGFARPGDGDPQDKDKVRVREVKPDPNQPDVVKRRGVDQPQVAPTSPELDALKKAIDQAEKNGADVTEIRKQLAALEKSLGGGKRVIVIDGGPDVFVPNVVVPRVPNAPNVPNVRLPVPAQPPVMIERFPQPNVQVFPQAGVQPFPLGVRDADAQKKIADLHVKIADLRVKLAALKEKAGADDPKVKELTKEIDELTRQLDQAQGGRRFPAGGQEIVIGQGGVVRGGGFGGGNQLPFGLFEPRLGVQVEAIPAALGVQLDLPNGQGVVVSGLFKDSAADKAGLKTGDILLEFAGKPVSDKPVEFINMVAGVKAGEKVDLVILRKGKKEGIKGVEVPETRQGVRGLGGFDPNVNLPPGFQPLQPLPTVRPRQPVQPVQPFPGGQGLSVSVQVQNDAFTITAQDDGLKMVMTGPLGKVGVPEPTAIEITDGGKTIKTTSVDKVPAEYRDRVKKVLESVRVGN